MALPGDWKEGGKRQGPHGVVLALLAGDLVSPLELQYAPDSGGSPDVGNAETIANYPPGPQRFVAPFPPDATQRWYRFRHARRGFTASGYTAWVAATPRPLPPTLPAIPDYPLTYVEIQEPDTNPANVIMRLRSWPDHGDIVWRWADLGQSTAVPPRSDSSTDWTFYPNSTSAVALCSTFSASFTPGENLTFKDYNGLTTATGVLVATDDATYVQFNLSTGWPRRSDTISGDASGTTCDIDDWDSANIARDASDPKRIAVWADLNGIYGPIHVFQIGPDLTPQILNATYGQGGDGDDGDACVNANLEVDKQTQLVKVYVRRDTGQGQRIGGSFTYNENSPSADSITRSTGSFVTDGFVDGDAIRVEGTTNNDGEYTVDTVVALTMTLAASEDLTQEGPVASDIESVTWPTFNGKSTGAIDESYYKGAIKPEDLNYEDCGYDTGDVVYHIWVPVTGTGQALGARWTGDGAAVPSGFSVTGTGGGGGPTARIQIAWRENTLDGTSCSVQRSDTAHWTTANASDANHDMRVYYRIDGGDWVLTSTETAPVTNTSEAADMGCYAGTKGVDPQITVDIRLVLWNTVGSFSEHEKVLNETELFYGTVCAV